MEQKLKTCYEIIEYIDSTIYWPPQSVTQVLVDYVSHTNNAVNHFIGGAGELKSFQQNAKDFAAFLESVKLYYDNEHP